jgi:hypothetical protein
MDGWPAIRDLGIQSRGSVPGQDQLLRRCRRRSSSKKFRGTLFRARAWGSAGLHWTRRAPGFAGLDQVNFTLPANVPTGCAVVIEIQENGIASMAHHFISIAPAGSSACTYSGYTTSQLQNLDDGALVYSGAFYLQSLLMSPELRKHSFTAAAGSASIRTLSFRPSRQPQACRSSRAARCINNRRRQTSRPNRLGHPARWGDHHAERTRRLRRRQRTARRSQ